MYYFGPVSSSTMFWLFLIIVFVVAEFLTTSLTTIWFVGGAIVAAAASALSAPFGVQIALFLITSFGLLLTVRPIATRYFNPERFRTNVDALLGREGVVTERIDNAGQTGTVKLDGMDWTARAAIHGQVMEQGQLVVVRAVDGVKLIVEPAAAVMPQPAET